MHHTGLILEYYTKQNCQLSAIFYKKKTFILSAESENAIKYIILTSFIVQLNSHFNTLYICYTKVIKYKLLIR